MQTTRFLVFVASLAMVSTTLKGADRVPESGDKAVEFKGIDINGNPVDFQPSKASKWTALIFLRGYPEYQCPICTRQVGELIAKKDDLAAANTNVILIYPGATKDLSIKAQEFMANKPLPNGFKFVVDQDYKIVNAYHLRWDAPRETAFPSTLVIDPSGFVRFAKVSKTHGDRSNVKEILEVVASKGAGVKKDPQKE